MRVPEFATGKPYIHFGRDSVTVVQMVNYFIIDYTSMDYGTLTANTFTRNRLAGAYHPFYLADQTGPWYEYHLDGDDMVLYRMKTGVPWTNLEAAGWLAGQAMGLGTHQVQTLARGLDGKPET